MEDAMKIFITRVHIVLDWGKLQMSNLHTYKQLLALNEQPINNMNKESVQANTINKFFFFYSLSLTTSLV